MKTEVNVTRFTDYRTFLVAHAQEMKRQRPSWSYGAWSKGLELKTTSSLTKIIQGTRNPGHEITEKLITYFQFSHRQAQYFRDLVRLDKIRKDPRLSVLLMEKMGREFANGSVKIMDDKSFLIISNWYYLALRELCRLKGFQEDPEWISRQFLFKVTPRDIQTAIKTLLQMRLLVRHHGQLHLIEEQRLDTSNDIASEAIKRYHEQMLEHAKIALRKLNVAQREITSVTLAISSKNMATAKDLIRNFKQEFERLLDEDAGDQVYQLQIQFFPLTYKIKEERSHENN